MLTGIYNSAHRRPGFLAPAVVVGTALALACDASPWPPPPDTARRPVADTLHGVAFTDDYRWLEEQASPETRAWIAAQNEYAERVVDDTPLRAALEARLAELMDVPGAVFPRRSGEYEYFLLRKPGREVAAIYRRPAPEEPEDGPLDTSADYEVVVDPLEIRSDGTTSVGIRDFAPDGSLMAYAVRDGGQDETSIRVRDLATGQDLPDRLPNALYGAVSFDEDGGGFHYVHRSRQTGPRLRHHVLGTPIDEDGVVFGDGTDAGGEDVPGIGPAGLAPTSFLGFSRAGDDRFVYTVQHGWARTDVYLHDVGAGAKPSPLVVGAPARFSVRWVDGELFMLTNLDAPNNRIVAVDLDAPDQADWREVLPETDDALTGYQIVGDDIFANYVHDASSRIVRYDMNGARIGELPVPDHHVATLRSWRDDSALLSLTSLDAPPHIRKLDLATLETDEWLPSRTPFDGDDYQVEQVWYTSKDGTQAPMYVAHKRGLDPAGGAPTLLYGYGGFNVSLLPRFDARAALWMELGGVYAMATLRGGGEFGERWHRAGMLQNKQNVFDDFIAAAEWLVNNGYAAPEKLAARGVSNGGLLVASAFTQRPDLFRAVFCGFPDLDLVRFYQFTETNNLPALLEYGNGAAADEFHVLRIFSPYQNVREGVRYPAVMFAQGDLDTRVPPLQARKMTARLQAATGSGLPVILDYDSRAGHAGGRSFSRNVRNAAMELAFLLGQLGTAEAPATDERQRDPPVIPPAGPPAPA